MPSDSALWTVTSVIDRPCGCSFGVDCACVKADGVAWTSNVIALFGAPITTNSLRLVIPDPFEGRGRVLVAATLVDRMLSGVLDQRRTQRRIMGALLAAMFAGVSLGRWLGRVREGAHL